MSPVEIAFDVVNSDHANKLPLVDASNTPTATIVPQEPVAASNSTAAELVAKVVVPDTEKVTAFLVYPLPLNSVPPPVSDGATVYKAKYKEDGEVYEVFVKTCFKSLSSK